MKIQTLCPKCLAHVKAGVKESKVYRGFIQSCPHTHTFATVQARAGAMLSWSVSHYADDAELDRLQRSMDAAIAALTLSATASADHRQRGH